MGNRKKYLSLLFVSFILEGTAQVSFTPGNIVVYRVGTGVANLTNASTPVFLDEYTSSGTLVQSIAMPIAVSGSNKILTAAGNGISEGLLNLSVNGQYLVFTGYNIAVGTSGVGGSASSTRPRCIGIVKYDATINTSTSLTDLSSGGPVRSAISTNGTDIWACGGGGIGGTGGVRYTAAGSATSTQLHATAPTNLRSICMASGQLYVSGNGGTPKIGSVGTGCPTTSGQTVTGLTGFPIDGTPGQFVLLNLDASIPGPDVMYVADDIDGIEKFSLVSDSWVSNGIVGAALDDYRALTATVSGSTVTIYATRKGSNSTAIVGGQLVKLTDAAGYNGAFSATPVVLASTITDKTAFRGVSAVPTQIVLPIKLISFTAEKISNDVRLNWLAGDALNFSHFEVERSSDGVSFSHIGRVALHETTIGDHPYDFKDAGILNTAALSAMLYYRLKMIDRDGHTEYSKMAKVANEIKPGLVRAFPDPFINEIFVQMNIIKPGKVTVSLINSNGATAHTSKLFLKAGENKITLLPPPGLPKGVYLLRVHCNDNVTSLKIIK
jgi:hypothetical protein